MHLFILLSICFAYNENNIIFNKTYNQQISCNITIELLNFMTNQRNLSGMKITMGMDGEGGARN